MRLWTHRLTLLSLAASLLLLTPTARAADLPLGTASGSDASLTTDRAHWTPMEPGSHPLYAATSLRAGKQAASAFLHGDTQLELQPGALITLTGTRDAPIVTIKGGRLFFRTSSRSTVTFITPTATYRTAGHGPRQTGELITAKATTVSDTDPIGAIVVNRSGHSTLTLHAGEMLSAPIDDSAAETLAQAPAAPLPPDISRELGFPDPTVPTVAEPSGSWGTMTALGIGVAAGGAGVGIGLSSHHKKASPSTP